MLWEDTSFSPMAFFQSVKPFVMKLKFVPIPLFKARQGNKHNMQHVH